MLNMRSIEHVSCDFCLVIAIMFLFFAAMILVSSFRPRLPETEQVPGQEITGKDIALTDPQVKKIQNEVNLVLGHR